MHDKVVNLAGETLGTIEQVMIDVVDGRVAYVVLSVGGFAGVGNKLFAVPWSAVTVDESCRRFVVNVTRQTLARVPGFDKDHWPDVADLEVAGAIFRHWAAG